MSRPPRFFITPEQVSGDIITVSGQDVRHIVTVLRMEPGEMLLLCDGKGAEYSARITAAGRSEVRAQILDRSCRASAPPHVTLCQGLPKADKMDFIVQKAAELGVFSIVPVVTERTIVKIRDEEKRTGRWQKIAREAAMQSNRPDIPLVQAVEKFDTLLAALAPEPEALLLLPWEEGTEPVRNVLRRHKGAQQVTVLIGPEGGFSPREAGMAREKGFHAVSLGPTILRTETAALVALALIGYELSAETA